MTGPNPERGQRVEVWVRDGATPPIRDRQEAILARLQQLEAQGGVTELSVRAWGKQVAADPMGQTQPVREKVAEFEAWAAENEHTLRPGITRREETTFVSDNVREVIVLPIVCIALYDGETLRGVFPCSDGTHVKTVDDCLTRLETETRF